VPVTDLTLREVALYQSVKITLAQGGTDVVDRKAQVVANRPGLMRVFVDLKDGFVARQVRARLELHRAGVLTRALEQTVSVSGPSTDADQPTTFNFELLGEDVTTDAEYAVSLLELSGSTAGGGGAAPPARFPEVGLVSFSALATASPFRVVVVPVRYNGDGSGRVPTLDTAAVTTIRNTLFNMFPVAQLDVTVREPMDFGDAITSSGDGWSELLDSCLSQRDADAVDPKVYYYCMFNPAVDFRTYCRGGCVAGLGPVPRANDTFSRGAIGLGFGDAAGTMAHELGHALGRPHAPCGGVAGPDPNYPYAGGSVGAWGYDMENKTLLSPEQYTDLMGYCNRVWISDYNYDLLFKRFQSVLTSPLVFTEKFEVMSLVVHADLSLSVGHALSLAQLPGSESVQVRYLASDGTVLSELEGRFSPASHANGGILYVKAPSANVSAIDVAGFGTVRVGP
jgi:hypothetical protein